LQRLQAEFDNYRKRITKEQEEQKQASNDALIIELIPIIDTLDLAITQSNSSQSNSSQSSTPHSGTSHSDPSGSNHLGNSVRNNSAKNNPDNQPLSENHLLEGMMLLRAQLDNLLSKYGVAKIPTQEQFDPRLHEALITESKDGVAKGTILTVMLQGYTRSGRVLRTAKVSVAK
jgi:molecular chaperone GrpE